MAECAPYAHTVLLQCYVLNIRTPQGRKSVDWSWTIRLLGNLSNEERVLESWLGPLVFLARSVLDKCFSFIFTCQRNDGISNFLKVHPKLNLVIRFLNFVGSLKAISWNILMLWVNFPILIFILKILLQSCDKIYSVILKLKYLLNIFCL